MSKSKTSNKEEKPAQLSKLIVISAPSGCGKTTIVERLLKRHPEWVRSISVTTRSPRQGEKKGEDYFFVSTTAFKEMEKKGEFLETAIVFDQQYGTPRVFVQENLKEEKNVLLAIDVQGARQIKKTIADADKNRLLTIFVLPPSVKVLRERLEGRKTESAEQISKRIEVAQEEIKEAGSYNLTVVNQNLDQTIAEIEDFIEKNKKGRSK